MISTEKYHYFLELVKSGIYSIDESGNIHHVYNPRTRKKDFHRVGNLNRGYLSVSFNYDNKLYNVLIHRVVYLYFFGPISDGYQVNHKNGVKTDNTPGNLELMTPSENTLHAYNVIKTRRNFGVRNVKAKVNSAIVGKILYIRQRRKLTYKQIGEIVGLSPCQAGKICRLQYWRHLYNREGLVGW